MSRRETLLAPKGRKEGGRVAAIVIKRASGPYWPETVVTVGEKPHYKTASHSTKSKRNNPIRKWQN